MPLVRLASEPDLVERVYDTLLAAISDGDLPPGSRLTQEQLAEKLDVSRQPVLQALRLLRRDGLVVDAGRRGVMVKPLEAEVIGHVYQLRAALDALAARLAAERKAALDPHLIESGRRAAKGRSVGAMIEADGAFHNAIYAASGNPLIAQSAHRHWAHVRRVMGAVLRTVGSRATVWEEHAAILEAIKRGDARSAERLSREHAELAGSTLARALGTRAEPHRAQRRAG